MEPMTAFLMAMQAAGLVSSAYSYKNKVGQIKLGRQLEQEQFTTNLQAIKLESDQQSLMAMRQLRKNIGSQEAANAALGRSGGSAYSGIAESYKSYNEDERTRRLNLLAKESQLRAGNVLSGLHTLESETRLGQELTSQILNTLPTTSLFDSFKNTSKRSTVSRAGSSASKSIEQFNWGI